MAISNTVQVQSYSGSLLSVKLLSGSTNNLVLNALGARSTAVITENSNQLVVGEVVSMGSAQVKVLGSGYVQVGVKVLGLTVPLDARYSVVLVENTVTGHMSFVFPEGAPNLVSAVALMVTAKPVSYTFPGGVLCFAEGTLIATPHGHVPVETLRQSQRVLTLDHGPRPVKWVLDRQISLEDLDERPNLLPVRIPAGMFGPDNPRRAIILSPQHRLLIDTPRAEADFGSHQVLVTALHLVGFGGVEVIRPAAGIRYIHLLMARHELLQAEGCVSESFYLGPEGIKGLDSAARAQIGRSGLTRMQPARPLLRKPDARALVGAILDAGESLQQMHYDWGPHLGNLTKGEDGAVRED